MLIQTAVFGGGANTSALMRQLPGARDKSGRKRKEHATTTQKIKLWKRSHSSPITIFSLYANMYQHMYRDFIKDENKKSQYQDTICSEAEEGHCGRPWEVLYNYIVDPTASQPSKETSRTFPLTEKNFPSFVFSEVDDC